MDKRRFKRSQFAVVLVLAPLNNTFERKCLIVPFAPDALKLGRQTTARTAAAPDNGFFDSRVLSRQHAQVWAERETGKVWLRDCRSSNGTYINNRRLSPENTESEPFELQRNDELDLGIDIVSNDDAKQMYHRISARVEKISVLLLQNTPKDGAKDGAAGMSTAGVGAGPPSAVGGLRQLQIPNSPAQSPAQSPLQSPTVSRKPSVETLRGAGAYSSIDGRSSEAVFGANTSLESMALNYASSTAGGVLVKESVRNHVEFELAAKRLVAQIRAVRADTAKLESLSALLADIKTAALETEHDDTQQREALARERAHFDAERRQAALPAEKPAKLKSSSMAALKAENARFRAELASLSKQRARARAPSLSSPQPPLPVSELEVPLQLHHSHQPFGQHQPGSPELPVQPVLAPSHSHKKYPTAAQAQHHAFVLVGTALLVTLVGVLIMFFFNPPMAPNAPFLFMQN